MELVRQRTEYEVRNRLGVLVATCETDRLAFKYCAKHDPVGERGLEVYKTIVSRTKLRPAPSLRATLDRFRRIVIATADAQTRREIEETRAAGGRFTD